MSTSKLRWIDSIAFEEIRDNSDVAIGRKAVGNQLGVGKVWSKDVAEYDNCFVGGNGRASDVGFDYGCQLVD
jgi:hypothetical protein